MMFYAGKGVGLGKFLSSLPHYLSFLNAVITTSIAVTAISVSALLRIYSYIGRTDLLFGLPTPYASTNIINQEN